MTDVYENKLTKAQIEELAAHCEKAELEAYEITKITDDYPQMTYKDAFDIQWEIRRRKEGRPQDCWYENGPDLLG